MKKSSKWKNQQELTAIKLPPKAHVELVRCRVQLLGRAAPTDTSDGIAAMQKPLCELYADQSTVESVITAYTSGLVLRTPAHVHAGAEELWFPIQDLLECGAMRPIGGPPPTAFVPLSSPEARRDSKRPALFAFVMKRRDIPTADCWAVVCQSDKAAMALLTACMMAHRNPAGWASPVDRPPSAIANKEITARAPPSEEWDGAAAKEAAQWSDKYPRDYYEKPPLQGFYYTPKTDLIQRYMINEVNPNWEEEQGGMFDDDQQPLTMPIDAQCPGEVGDTPNPKAPATYLGESDMYGFPPGMQGTFVPESLIYPNDERYQDYGSDLGAHHGQDRHEKKKKSKKSKHKKEKLYGKYDYYTGDDGVMIIPQETMTVGRAAPRVEEEPFESRLPEPDDLHQVVDEEYDPAWHYNMKSYIRGQQYVAGHTDPVVGRPYESHIEQIPPADYAVDDPYSDSGLYERRLPVTAGARAAKSDHKMLNRNFIMRQSDNYRRQL